ncbi:hypothetical protein [Methylobacterium oryzihabitans]|uniref:Uncharacterized protein n=1 Tax=Methylobacterium oryzihabitans TaxID=2499852 RepID=A0A437NVH9_9HYPH|nr:hypothetical protein [Methylobacterium oryzihabitans]RVU14030.1 hypothetical protein EOE48_25200 [Methylobacterium oryzihabitans]
MSTITAPGRKTRPDMRVPATWRTFLTIVTIGKGALAGAGAAIALLGLYDVAAAATAQEWLHQLRPASIDAATAGGGVIGAAITWFVNR